MTKLILTHDDNKNNVEFNDNMRVNIDNNNVDDVNINIYRFKFSDEITNELLTFSKMNQYVDRILYKEKWSEWVSENKELVDREISRLQKLGYEGDILDKMFKASRYYFRKKSLSKTHAKSRQKYNSLDQDILYKMDIHILHNMKKDDYTPASGYSSFCLEHVDILKTEIKRLLNNETISPDSISHKIKKTYKNRYFIISRNSKKDIDKNDNEYSEDKEIELRMKMNENMPTK